MTMADANKDTWLSQVESVCTMIAYDVSLPTGADPEQES